MGNKFSIVAIDANNSIVEEHAMQPADMICAWCNRPHDIAEFWEASTYQCKQCRQSLIAAEDMNGDLHLYREYGPLARRPNNHATTQRRWRRQGRR